MVMKRIVLGVEYNGSGWQGWQTQPHGLTVQDQLEAALGKFTKLTLSTHCAGRTDTGVHALEQVVHFDTDLERPMYSWINGVNAFLPDSIAVRWAKEIHITDYSALDNFHARFSAFSRTYHYVIHNSPVRSPIWSARAGWVFRPLDVASMQVAADQLVGEHDFTVFRAAGCQAKSPVKHMYSVQVRQQGELIICSFRANAFLHHMVRNMVGALIFVGVGRRNVSWIAELVASRDRGLAAPTFAPDGLYLAKIGYDKKWALPQGDEFQLLGFNFENFS
jgi:tRNA pseudouridine38-40 synthase